MLVIVGAMIGAPARYLLDRTVQSRHNTVLPWGTITVNFAGCLIIGILTAAALSTPWAMFLGPGLCATFTTYSTFNYETLRLAERDGYRHAALNVIISLTGGLAMTVLGFAATTALIR
ncbi:fluoride efflux transporter CrcB [Nocardia sp. NPDC058114]|uniref:fluoride efflux transporter CrcB n=1 Tax=Nocardia sp. NPDC058114 TaxID=3346346 RepID=UPI0036DC4DEF